MATSDVLFVFIMNIIAIRVIPAFEVKHLLYGYFQVNMLPIVEKNPSSYGVELIWCFRKFYWPN